MTLFSRVLLLLLALSPLAAGAATPASLVEGRDYQRIANPGPFQPLDGRIEVVELFGYTCPHCAHFEPHLEAWVARLPADVRFTAVPAAFGGHWDAYARAFYAAEQVGAPKRSHSDMFRALHEQHRLPMQNVSDDELAGFYASHGVQPQRYIAALHSAEVEQKVRYAREFALRTQVPGTPSLLVNGKYLVKGSTFQDMLRNAEALLARERAASPRH